MFDFRYHALSLVAVFLALALGILLGATIGVPVVEDAGQNLRSGLREDLASARESSDERGRRAERQERLIETLVPGLTEGRLAGRDVALVGIGELPGSVEAAVRQAVVESGGTLDSVSVVGVPPGGSEPLARALDQPLEPRPDLAELEGVGQRLGTSIVAGNDLVERLRTELPDAFEGDYFGARAVVVYREPAEEVDPAALGADERRQRDVALDAETALQDGMLEGMADAGVELVGVEELTTEESQVPFFRSRDVTTVDNVDTAGGRLALVLALRGADGAFGYKDTADRPVPLPTEALTLPTAAVRTPE